VKCTSVFSKNIKAYQQGKTLIVNQGGTRSSKTYSIMQLLFLIALGSKKKLVISVCSYALPHLKLGSMRDLEEIIENYGMLVDQVKNITESTFHIGNSIIEFFGTDNLGKVHGPARDILFINECNYVKYDAFDQLAIRTKGCVFLDFNPTREFWYHTEVVGKLEYEFVQSTYLDNEFLTAAQIERIEAKKNNENWWRVYGLGELGRLEGAILQNWEFGEFDYSLPYGYGLDFGVKDPDAMVKVAVDRANQRLYWKEELYQNSMSTSQLTQAIKARNTGSRLIIADSAAIRTILDLKGQGLNIKAVSKGLINDDIKMLLDWQIIVDPESFNLQKELNNWVWLDKKGEVPIDSDNHLIDAGRYYSRTVIKPISKHKGHRAL
jgi:phage terminase large subunit